jgi:CRP-like cAMP-binding protein
MDAMSDELFDPAAFLLSAGSGRRIVEVQPEQLFFSQGDPADSVFYLRQGRVKLSVVSVNGKLATISLLVPGDFFGEESLETGAGQRAATVIAVNRCIAVKIKRDEMIRLLHQKHRFSDHFLSYLVGRSRRTQADLADQIVNSSEKRLARALLLMSEMGNPEDAQAMIPPITQETLAEIVGTTRSRISFFMNRFRDLGLISYKERIRVHRPRLQAVLQGQLAGM